MPKTKFLEYFEKNKLEAALVELKNDISNCEGKRKKKLENQYSLLHSRFQAFKGKQIEGVYTSEEEIRQRNILRVSISKLGEIIYDASSSKIGKRAVPITIYILLFSIILYGLFVYFKQPKRIAYDSFALTVNVVVKDSQNNGCKVKGEKLLIQLEEESKSGLLDEYCETIFNGIPNVIKEHNLPLKFILYSNGYELVHPDSQYHLPTNAKMLSIELQLKDSFGKIKGKVWEENAEDIVKNARVEVDGTVVFTDSLGNFDLKVGSKKYHELVIFKEGYEIKRVKYSSGANSRHEIILLKNK